MDFSSTKDLYLANLYADFNGIHDLKASAKSNDKEALHEVTKQFEALMLQMLLKSAREANRLFGNDLMSSHQTEFYEDLFDQQMAVSLSGSGFGLAKMLEDELTGNVGSHITETKHEIKANTLIEDAQGELTKEDVMPQTKTSLDIVHDALRYPIPTNSATALNTAAAPYFTSREDFVNKLWSYAKTAASIHKLNPKVLLAQAALETGWGSKIAKDDNGQSSFNLFGIKGGKTGLDTVSSMTTEYMNGERIQEKALFRKYSTFLESFMDYMNVLSTDRYRDALENSHDNMQFLSSLQKAGYATDPQYAKKIASILESDIFKGL